MAGPQPHPASPLVLVLVLVHMYSMYPECGTWGKRGVNLGHSSLEVGHQAALLQRWNCQRIRGPSPDTERLVSLLPLAVRAVVNVQP